MPFDQEAIITVGAKEEEEDESVAVSDVESFLNARQKNI
jgi:hypothetical protein